MPVPYHARRSRNNNVTINRRHDIDALRAMAFGLLILYHVGMYYVADWPWHLKSVHASEWLRWPMVSVNVWRMDLVFLVSGVAFGFLCRGRRPMSLIGRRAVRLLVPLLFGMAFIVPYQAYVQGVANGLVAPGFGAFMARYLSGGPWPKGAFDGSDFPMTWNHLWYLAYLFAYTAVLALLMPAFRSAPGLRIRAAFLGLRGWRLLAVPALPVLLFTLWLAPRFPVTDDLVHDWYQHALFFTVFLYGFWMSIDEGIWCELERLRGWAAVIALGCVGAYLLLRFTSVGPETAAWIARSLRTVYLWSVLVVILGFAHRHLNRPWPWLGWANESVYPWYMLHQTLIIAGAVTLAPLRLGPVFEPIGIIVATVAGCWLLTDALIRRFRWLRPLFGLRRQQLQQPSPNASTGVVGI
ncbi:Peptidoglycan/LPS O-acetylase OafA/YrhL, contains acyltransferase and SGNH-hydrolase domains [Variovorax sp. HW608]|nr:Peptidoglycan/LPS O-acetylase OafA/YrhL, contains acyltransferase and SGNH-hydrolase domains [Variovorax sp. HW608]